MAKATARKVFLLVAALAACTRPTGESPARILQVQLSAEPVSLDPALAEDGAALRILANVMEGLVGYDGGGRLQHRLAQSHRVSGDGLRYEFTIRGGALWSDGQPVRAGDFVHALRHALSRSTGGKLAGMLFPIRGARELHAAKIPPERLGVSAVSDDLLVIELEHPAPYFLQALTLPLAAPLRGAPPWTRDSPVTGPYRIVAHQADRHLKLEPNPHYWGFRGRDLATRPAVLLRIVREESTASNLFERGQLDILTKVPTFDVERLRRKGVLRIDPFLATYYLSFNLSKPPFNRRELRRAVSAAIRRRELASVLGTGETPARSWIPPGIEGFVPYQEAVAPAAAPRRLARKAGLVVAGFDASGRNSLVMEKIQQDLVVGLGLRLSLQGSDWKSYVRGLSLDPPPLFRFAWMAPFLDPIPHLRAHVTGDPSNYARWSNARYDRLVEEIGALEPGPEREARIHEAQRILVDEEAVIVPLYHYVQAHAVSDAVQNFRVSPFGIIRFDELSLR